MTTTVIYAGTEDADVYKGGGGVYTDGSGTSPFGAPTDLYTGYSTVSPGYNMEACVRFDTSPIGDADGIDSGTLELDGSGDASTVNDDLEARSYDWGATVTGADYLGDTSFAALTLLATWNMANYSAAYNTFVESGTALRDAINKTGYTSMIIAQKGFRQHAPVNGYVAFHSADQAGTTEDPKLTVVHSVPVQNVVVPLLASTLAIFAPAAIYNQPAVIPFLASTAEVFPPKAVHVVEVPPIGSTAVLFSGAVSQRVAVPLIESSAQVFAPGAIQIFHAPRAPRKRGGLPLVSALVDEREVPLGDWTATTKAHGGDDTLNGKLPARYLNGRRDWIQQEAPIDLYDATGTHIWAGKLLRDPAVDGGSAEVSARGWMSDAEAWVQIVTDGAGNVTITPDEGPAIALGQFASLEPAVLLRAVAKLLGWDTGGIDVGIPFRRSRGIWRGWDWMGNHLREGDYSAGHYRAHFDTVETSALNILPYNFQGASSGALAELCEVLGWRWLVLPLIGRRGPGFEAGPWRPVREVRVPKIAPRPEERFNGLEVVYQKEDESWARETRDFEPDAFRSIRTASGRPIKHRYRHELAESDRSDAELALLATFAAQALEPIVKAPHFAATVEVLEADGGSPYTVRGGQSLRLVEHEDQIDFQVTQTSMRPSGVEAGLGQPVSIASVLAVASKALARGPLPTFGGYETGHLVGFPR